MIDPDRAQRLIKNEMPVVCSKDGQFAIVDHMEGSHAIKLAKDSEGRHHYIPLTWVCSVDDKVHLDRSGEQAMIEWATTPDDLAALVRDVEAPRHINSSDATMGQPMVARVHARKQELEQVLSSLPEDAVRTRGDIALALSTIAELMTGDLDNIPTVVVKDMSNWLEHNKHLAESAVETVIDATTSPVVAKQDPEA